MIANAILNFLVLVVGTLLLPLQAVTTLLTGLLLVITFGLAGWIFSTVWSIAFLAPLLGSSWAWLNLPWSCRWLVTLPGLVHALLAALFSNLVTEGGDLEARKQKLRLTCTWPASLLYLRAERGAELTGDERELLNTTLGNAGV